ncbi:MAG: (2Fe-2S) ferredoxin domain-containing protein [Actinobacteria bacterium]|nr:(2Fe-2S) ferredoxin domain-containing protein [Actinomycetota bacterium]MBU2110993.1 (2Fe-2S) ferredoxin domain-containing protein [Actinomycetota bacterium]
MTLPDRDLLLCRDCCCGSPDKHPDVDHDALREALLTGAARVDGAQVRVRVVDCLAQCDRSNVLLVRDFATGGRPHDTWLGQVLDHDTVGAVLRWAAVGGPVPPDLAGLAFAQVRR